MAITATYVSASSFTVNGDLTADFSVGVRVKADCGADGTKYGTVSNSVYTSLTTVTVTLDSGSLTSNLVGVYHSNDRPISLVNHTHTGAASGGTIGKVDYHGVESGFSSITMVGDVLTIGAATNKYWYQGVPFSTTSAIACDLSSTSARDGSDTAKQTNRLYFIYFKDSTGTLYWSQQAWSMTTKVPVATAYYNGSAWAVSRETHGHTRNLAWHENAHKTIGARYESGLDKTLPTSGTPAALTISAGVIYDEDIAISIAQQTTARAFYQASGGVYTFSDISLPYTGTSGAPTYLNTSTYALTAVTSSKYCCYWFYASSDLDRPIYVIPTQATAPHDTLAKARAEMPPSLAGLGLTPELKLIYRLAYKGDGALGDILDYRTATSLPSGFTASSTAAAVSFAPAGNVSATTVQAAIEELDGSLTGVVLADCSVPFAGGHIQASGAYTGFKFTETGAATNAGKWIYQVDSNQASLLAVNDAESVFNPVWTADRSGATPTYFTVTPPMGAVGGIDTDTINSQDVSSGLVTKSLLTTAGDLIVATAANTPARLGVGSEGQALKIVSGVPGWGDVSALSLASNDEALAGTNTAKAISPSSLTYALLNRSTIKRGSFTRDLSTSSSTQSITGVGFTPKAIIVHYAVHLAKIMGFGMADAASGHSVCDLNVVGYVDSYATLESLISAYPTLSDNVQGNISSFNSDGFSISFTKNGSPTGTLVVSYLAMR